MVETNRANVSAQGAYANRNEPGDAIETRPRHALN